MLKVTGLPAAVAIEKSAVWKSSDTPAGKEPSIRPFRSEPAMRCWEASTVKSDSASSFSRARFPYSINDSEFAAVNTLLRSEERRVGKERRSWWQMYHKKKKQD